MAESCSSSSPNPEETEKGPRVKWGTLLPRGTWTKCRGLKIRLSWSWSSRSNRYWDSRLPKALRSSDVRRFSFKTHVTLMQLRKKCSKLLNVDKIPFHGSHVFLVIIIWSSSASWAAALRWRLLIKICIFPFTFNQRELFIICCLVCWEAELVNTHGHVIGNPIMQAFLTKNSLLHPLSH